MVGEQKEQKFADIVIFTKTDFESFPSSAVSTNVKIQSPSSTSVTTSPPSTLIVTTTSSSIPTSTSTAHLSTLAKRQRDFSEVSSRQKRRRLCDLNSQLDEFASANNLSVNQVLIWNNNFMNGVYIQKPNTNKVDLDQALALKSHLNLSRADVDFVKWFSNDFINIPSRQFIKSHTDNLSPSLKSCRNDKCICEEDRKEPIQLTIQRLIGALHSENIDVSHNLLHREKTGHDGVDSMSIYRSNKSPMCDPSKMFVPLALKDEKLGTVLWHNRSPNSAFYTRPLLLIAEKENHELLRFVSEQFEHQEKSLEENGLTFQYKYETYNVRIEIEASMKDMKVRIAESGLGGAEC
ncbi:unnamed protein product [Didymodactylos carnosus]|uniref:V(D)J recombination-activating protein 1 RNase H domain-containing protein n=1 Tax=Didymodactylos carnosus TaxID=1234261 RepID=A0A8S2CYJ6_9BILA|nr:unnamed protein product [Didymodactylos carnosus]CAF3542095.1 unnamed protein product [Didymodactylos carnosus]